jgi:S-sulfo-L-cysteine synthase (O-acetyl-L-serine-dependent)
MLIKESKSSLLNRVFSLEPFIGNTPLFPLNGTFKKPGVTIYAKLEWYQLGNSVKARPAFNIIKEAVASGKLDEHIHLLDASSGNTGVAYGAIGAALGLQVTLALPANASSQKKNALKAHGVNIIETSRFEGTDGAQEYALELYQNNPELYYYADQYSNENNWKAHYYGTGREIFDQTRGKITHFVAGLGTTGTFTGTARRLKENNPGIEVISLQPDFAMHALEGWKHLETAKVPKIYDPTLADRNLEVSTEEAYALIKELARKDGLLLSPSSAANLVGAIRVAKELDSGVVVTVFPDHGSNYPELSI